APDARASVPTTAPVTTPTSTSTSTSTSTTAPKPIAPKPGRVLVVGDSVAFSIAASVLQASPNGTALGMSSLSTKALIACTLARWATKARFNGTVSDVSTCTTWPQLWQPELDAHPDTALLVIGNPGAQELQTPD